MGCIWLLNSPVSLLASFYEQAETGNSPITQYIVVNCFPDAKVTLQQLLYSSLCGIVHLSNGKSGRRHLRNRSLTTAFHYSVLDTLQKGFHKDGRN